MAQAYGNQYDNSTGLKDSFLDLIKLVMLDETPLFNKLKSSKANQKAHTWYRDSLGVSAGTVQGSLSAAVEGADASYSTVADFTELTNYCQNVQVSYYMSGDMLEAEYKGISEGQESYQRKKAMKKWAIEYEKSLIMGTGAAGASGTARVMRGLDYFCTAVTANTVTAATSTFNGSVGQTALDSALVAIFEGSGEKADTVMIAPTVQNMINQWTNYGTRFLATNEGSELKNRFVVYRTAFGDVEMMISTVTISTNINIFKAENTYNAWFRKPVLEKLGKTGDTEKYMIVGSGTMEMRSDLCSGVIQLQAS